MHEDDVREQPASARGPLACLVCGRGDDSGKRAPVKTLPNGMRARVCDECYADRFRVAEAERRAGVDR